MLVKNVITIMKRIMSVNQRSVQLVDVIRMLIGLIDIFANHTRQKARINETVLQILRQSMRKQCSIL